MDRLGEYRAELDKIDEQLIQLLAKRFAVTQEVGEYKKEHQLNSVDPAREAQQFARIDELCKRNSLDPAFAHALFRLIIDHVVANHNKIKQQS